MATVLLVEDDPGSRELLETIVRHLGHAPLACARAEQVDLALDQGEPALAILDINLPAEHGVSLGWRLRNRYEGLPIVIASAVLESWDPDDLRDCGADAMIAKPYRMERLAEVIRAYIEHGREATGVLN